MIAWQSGRTPHPRLYPRHVGLATDIWDRSGSGVRVGEDAARAGDDDGGERVRKRLECVLLEAVLGDHREDLLLLGPALEHRAPHRLALREVSVECSDPREPRIPQNPEEQFLDMIRYVMLLAHNARKTERNCAAL
eukprot:3383185-Pyramimonas_sp.AAC.1